MTVCKLAVLSFKDNTDYGGYSIGDLKDCIAMAQWNIELECDHIVYVDVDLKSFIKWAKYKIKVLKEEGNGKDNYSQEC